MNTLRSKKEPNERILRDNCGPILNHLPEATGQSTLSGSAWNWFQQLGLLLIPSSPPPLFVWQRALLLARFRDPVLQL